MSLLWQVQIIKRQFINGQAKTRKIMFCDARKNTSYFVPPHRKHVPDIEGKKIRYIRTHIASPAIPNHEMRPGNANTKIRKGKKYLRFKVTWRARRYKNLKSCISDQCKIKILILRYKNNIIQLFVCVQIGGLVLCWNTLECVCNYRGK